MGYIFAAMSCQMTKVKHQIFQAKKGQNFELQKCYIPQKKAENMYNNNSARKVGFLEKEK